MPITFRQWSRKNYAIFSSLGKEVIIGHVDIDICDKAQNKGLKKDYATNLTSDSIQLKNDDEDDLTFLGIEAQVMPILAITSKLDDSSRHCRRTISKNFINNLIGFLLGS